MSAHSKAPIALLSMVLLIATAGLVYELAIAAVASYLLGDSVRQFSLIIGIYLSALGAGAYLSRFVEQRLAIVFVEVELAAAVVGGFSVPLLIAAYPVVQGFQLLLYSVVAIVGTLVGLELPLLMRLLERQLELKELLARALTFDYAGALLGSIGFSLLLVPHLGLLKSSLVCGLLNAGVALASTWVLPRLARARPQVWSRLRIQGVFCLCLLVAGLLSANALEKWADEALYQAPVTHTSQSRYQRIVTTKALGGMQLFLNGNLQFSAADETRYHEALVHPAMAAAKQARRVLIGGGGDGLAAREVLRWPDVSEVVLVDLDSAVTHLANTHPELKELNRGSLRDPRVRVVHQDAFTWTAQASGLFDVAILDFPDPTNYSLSKLYTRAFYRRIERLLSPRGIMVVQASSPLLARRSFWCVNLTIERSGFETRPYHAWVPSFGEWGFVMARPIIASETKASRNANWWPRSTTRTDLKWLTDQRLSELRNFPKDMQPPTVEANNLSRHPLVGYYLEELGKL